MSFDLSNNERGYTAFELKAIISGNLAKMERHNGEEDLSGLVDHTQQALELFIALVLNPA